MNVYLTSTFSKQSLLSSHSLGTKAKNSQYAPSLCQNKAQGTWTNDLDSLLELMRRQSGSSQAWLSPSLTCLLLQGSQKFPSRKLRLYWVFKGLQSKYFLSTTSQSPCVDCLFSVNFSPCICRFRTACLPYIIITPRVHPNLGLKFCVWKQSLQFTR